MNSLRQPFENIAHEQLKTIAIILLMNASRWLPQNHCRLKNSFYHRSGMPLALGNCLITAKGTYLYGDETAKKKMEIFSSKTAVKLL